MVLFARAMLLAGCLFIIACGDSLTQTMVTTGPAVSASTGEPGTGGTTAPTTGFDGDPCAACGPGTYCAFRGSDDVCDFPPGSMASCEPLPAGCEREDMCSLPCVHALCGTYLCSEGLCGVEGAVYGCRGWYRCDVDGACPVNGTVCKLVSHEGDPGFDWYDDFDCVPRPDPAAGVGEPCGMLTDGAWTWSSCAEGSECSLFAANMQGQCKQLCGPPGKPGCDAPGTVCVAYTDSIGLCEPSCDPLAGAAACEPDAACVRGEAGFACVHIVAADSGGLREPCERVDQCDPGLTCVIPEALVGCTNDGVGCCAPWCDLTQPVCPDVLSCTPAFTAGEAPPGHEDVGICMAAP
jgi:hypothetical protein